MQERRKIRKGDRFTLEELFSGEVELEEVKPRKQIPIKEQTEPWNRREEDGGNNLVSKS